MRYLLTVLALLLAVPAVAPAQAITSYTLTVYGNFSFGSRMQTVDATAVTCNVDPQLPRPAGTWSWDDTGNAGRECRVVPAFMATLPAGDYGGTAVATNATGSSAETMRVPFVVGATPPPPSQPPAVPTGLRITP